MKITSQLLKTLVLTATSVATSVVLFSSSPAQAVNLIKNGNYGGTVDFPWEGNAYPQTDITYFGKYGNIFQLLSEPTDPLKKYQISFDFDPQSLPMTLLVPTAPAYGLEISIGDKNIFSLLLTPQTDLSQKTFTTIFDGNGSNKLSFRYFLKRNYDPQISINNLAVEDLSPPSATSAPEPLTIVGTIIGGTAAFRLKKRLEASQKDDPN